MNKNKPQSKPNSISVVGLVILIILTTLLGTTIQAQEVLPFPEEKSSSKAGVTIANSVYNPTPAPRRIAEDAPNIVIILIDDIGNGTADTFGGEIHTPNLSRVAENGITYNRFHSTAMCSPTRSSLLTGRNHTAVGNGQICEISNDWDGYRRRIPKSAATIAEV